MTLAVLVTLVSKKKEPETAKASPLTSG